MNIIHDNIANKGRIIIRIGIPFLDGPTDAPSPGSPTSLSLTLPTRAPPPRLHLAACTTATLSGPRVAHD